MTLAKQIWFLRIFILNSTTLLRFTPDSLVSQLYRTFKDLTYIIYVYIYVAPCNP